MSNLREKEEKTIRFLRSLERENMNLGFSGGKDSIVLLHLAERSGIKYTPSYANTTIDPPGHIKFIKTYFPQVEIIHPEKSFFKLIQEKALPTRVGRYCCQYLKEIYGIGNVNIDGTRKEESVKRSNYTFEDCDTRKWMKGAIHIRPILEWTEEEIWAYIKKYKLSYSVYYKPPYCFKRLGCVGCPYAGVKTQIHEFRLWPKYAYAILKSIRIYMESKPNSKMANDFSNEYETFYWWLSGYGIEEYIRRRQKNLFPINNFKILVENALKPTIKEKI